ncbi:MAG: methyltransferase domain-containing protein [Nanoarchaeota archaeon]|nr:methyltransferase domain-containing protein [Nanoarchaeota archaeon]
MTYYNAIADGYDNLHKEEQIKKIKIILENLEIKKTDKLLDVGCGTGLSFDFFDCECYGLDPSEELLAKCENKKVQLFLGCAEQLPFEDDYFDVVTSVTAIHNFDDIEKGLLEMKRVGKGRFAYSVLKKAIKFKEIELLINKHFDVKKRIDEEKDTIFFT